MKATIRMSRASSQEKSGAEKKATRRSRITTHPPRIASQTRTTCTISLTSWTRTRWAPPRTAAATAAAVPKSRSPTGRSSTLPRKLLRDGPTSTGRSRSRSSGRRRSTSRLWPASLAKPRPGSTSSISRGDPRRLAPGQGRPEARPSPRPSRRRRSELRCMSSKPPRRCMTTAGTLRSATRGAISGSKRKPLTSLTRSAPASRAARATSAFVVSTESGPAPRARRSRTTGTTRRRSSSTPTRRGPGPGRLPAHVHDVGAGLEERQPAADRGIGPRRSGRRPRTSRG